VDRETKPRLGSALLAGLVVLTVTHAVAVPALPAAAAASAAWAGGPVAAMDVLTLGTDGSLYMQGWDAHGWGGWAPVSGAAPGWPGTASAPAAASWGPGRMDVFVRGTDNALWHLWWNAAGWGGWESLGGSLASAPAVAAWSTNRLDVFARGTDGTLQHIWSDGMSWSGWESLGGALTSAPAAASWAAGRLDLFVRGTDNALYHRWWGPAAWSAWERLGGVVASDPAAASWGAGRIDVFVEGSDSQLYHRWYQGGWSGFEARGGVLNSGPAAASWAPGQLDVFARGTDGGAWHTRWGSYGWTGWSSLLGGLSSPPAATAWLAQANVIQNVPYDRQVRELSCEEAALQMALAHQGIAVTQDRILNDVGVDRRAAYYDPHGVLHWGDPYLDFVGNPDGSEVSLTGYGTFWSPIARVAQAYGANVVAAGERTSPQAVYDAVLGNHPVVAWVSFDWKYHPPGSWVAFDGRAVQYEGPVEHTVTVIGVNQSQVYVNNPWSGPQWVDRATFEAAYLTYDDMAVITQ
jgi:uncharacterized protein YvpB